MTRIGYLSPEGELHECEPWEHLDKATEIAESLTHRTPLTRLDAEQYLLNLGYLVVASRSVYGNTGFPQWVCDDTGKLSDKPTGRILSVTKKQRDWLETNYEEMNTEKQRSVDRLLDER